MVGAPGPGGVGAGGTSGPGSGGVGFGLGTGGAGAGAGGAGAGALTATGIPRASAVKPHRGVSVSGTPGRELDMSEQAGVETAPQIDWTSAEVSDGELTVAFVGEVPKGWVARLKALLERLGQTGSEQWGQIKVSKGKIAVEDLREGSEPDLRHLLESAVLQANADLAPHEEDPVSEESPERARDGRMTAAFRAFAPEE